MKETKELYKLQMAASGHLEVDNPQESNSQSSRTRPRSQEQPRGKWTHGKCGRCQAVHQKRVRTACAPGSWWPCCRRHSELCLVPCSREQGSLPLPILRAKAALVLLR